MDSEGTGGPAVTHCRRQAFRPLMKVAGWVLLLLSCAVQQVLHLAFGGLSGVAGGSSSGHGPGRFICLPAQLSPAHGHSVDLMLDADVAGALLTVLVLTDSDKTKNAHTGPHCCCRRCCRSWPGTTTKCSTTGPQVWAKNTRNATELVQRLRALPLDHGTWAKAARNAPGAFAAWSHRIEAAPGPLAATAGDGC